MGIISTPLEGCTLRRATEEDVPLILGFIIELAEYEELADEVEATEDLLREHLFGERPAAEVVFVCYDDEPVGFALYFWNFSTFTGVPGLYLEDLYVRPSMRGKGLGTLLFSWLARQLLQRRGARFEWVVLTWNKPAIEFYHRIGAKTVDRQLTNRLIGEPLQEMAERYF